MQWSAPALEPDNATAFGSAENRKLRIVSLKTDDILAPDARTAVPRSCEYGDDAVRGS